MPLSHCGYLAVVHKVAAIVLAAGRSRRMGKFKPLLPFGDRTVIESCVNNFQAAGVVEIVVVLGHRAEQVREQLKATSVTFVTNPDPDSEMSVSIALGVAAIGGSSKAVLITPADHPAVPSETIQRLMERSRTGSKLIQPEFEGKGGHPVLIDLSYREELAGLESQSGLRGLFDRHRSKALRLPVDSPFVARDMDTWEDYCALHEDVFGRKPTEIAGRDDH